MPTLRRLKVFVEAASDCNFRKTADRLGISQAGLSDHIIMLERELGRQLFERRRGTTPRLCADATDLLVQARATLEAARTLTRSEDAGPGVAQFKVVVRNFVLRKNIVPALPDFLERNPGIDLLFDPVEDTSEIIDRVTSGVSDLGLFRSPKLPSCHPVRVDTLGPSEMFLFAAPSLARAVQNGTAISDLPFALMKDGNKTVSAVDHALAVRGIVPRKVVGRSRFAETLADWVREGRAVSVLFLAQMSDAVRAGEVVPLGPPIATWHTVLLSNLGEHDPHARRVADFFRSCVQERTTG